MIGIQGRQVKATHLLQVPLGLEPVVAALVEKIWGFLLLLEADLAGVARGLLVDV